MGGAAARFRCLAVVLVLPWLSLACGGAGPSGVPQGGGTPPPQPGGTPPPPPPAAVVTRVDISGPPSIAPGQTATFTARATFSDGTTRDVTAEARWESHNTQVLTVDRGVVTSHERGEADLLATFGNQLGFKQQVLVLPDGTFRVRGAISDAGLGLSGARVEVISGSGIGLAAISDTSCIGCGGYALYGVTGPSEIRVSKDGYTTKTLSVTVIDHQQLNIELTPIGSSADPSGTYRLTITAAAECRAALPADAQERSYGATVTRDGRKLKVTLDAPALDVDIAGNGRGFVGALESNRLFFLLSPAGYSPWDLYLYHASITERMTPPPLKLTISGTLITSSAATSLSGTLDGVIQTVEFIGEGVITRAECRSAAHQVMFQR